MKVKVTQTSSHTRYVMTFDNQHEGVNHSDSENTTIENEYLELLEKYKNV